jgi:hypothetical protein
LGVELRKTLKSEKERVAAAQEADREAAAKLKYTLDTTGHRLLIEQLREHTARLSKLSQDGAAAAARLQNASTALERLAQLRAPELRQWESRPHGQQGNPGELAVATNSIRRRLVNDTDLLQWLGEAMREAAKSGSMRDVLDTAEARLKQELAEARATLRSLPDHMRGAEYRLSGGLHALDTALLEQRPPELDQSR